MKPIVIPTDLSRKELFAFLKANKAALIQQKKVLGKTCDDFAHLPILGSTSKATPAPVVEGKEILDVKAVINTTNWLDSHLDVHFPGLWDKSIEENKMMMHLQEHSMMFDKIIADGEDLKVSTKFYTWKELGYKYAGKTEALIFDSVVKKSRNAYMYDQYANGYVKNHSVYMIYIKMILAINEPDSPDYGSEYEAWVKYLPEIVNKDFAEEMGYFWGIKEAKVIEGSAVPRGSNIITPTISVEPRKHSAKQEPSSDTPSHYELNIGAPDKGSLFEDLQLNKI